ncbi:hypothetical protein BDW75DRAFT_174180 [Aspergillus navahoensis]
MKFTLYAVARALGHNPDGAKRCVDEGHNVASHACRWVNYHDFNIEKGMNYNRKPVASLKSLTGYAPQGWYCLRMLPLSNCCAFSSCGWPNCRSYVSSSRDSMIERGGL